MVVAGGVEQEVGRLRGQVHLEQRVAAEALGLALGRQHHRGQPVGGERDPLAVGRPRRLLLVPRVVGDALARVRPRVHDPEIRTAVRQGRDHDRVRDRRPGGERQFVARHFEPLDQVPVVRVDDVQPVASATAGHQRQPVAVGRPGDGRAQQRDGFELDVALGAHDAPQHAAVERRHEVDIVELPAVAEVGDAVSLWRHGRPEV